MRGRPAGSRIKLLIFDLDGTLVDSAPDISDSLNILRSRYALPPLTSAYIVKAIGKGLGYLMSRTLPLSIRRANRSHQQDFRRIYGERIMRRTRAYPGVVRTLARIKGPVLTLASNKPQRLTVALLRKLGIFGWFKAIICADRVKRPKPHPEVILTLMHRFGAEARETLVVGDSRYDMEAGTRAGARTCAVTYGYGTLKEVAAFKPDYVIGSFPSLLGVINGTQKRRTGRERGRKP